MEPVQQGLERSLAVSAFRPIESRLTEPVSQGLGHNMGRTTGLSLMRSTPEPAAEQSYRSEPFSTTLAKVDMSPRRTPCGERANGLPSRIAGSNGCSSLRGAFAEHEDQRKHPNGLQQQMQQQQLQVQQPKQYQAHLWPRSDNSSTPGTRVQAETPTSEQPSTPRGQLGAASRQHTAGYDDLIGTCTTIAVSGQPELSELVQAVHRLELKFAALRTEVTAEISCQVRSAAASAQLYQKQQHQQQQQQPDTCCSAAEAESIKLKVEALQRGATRAATAQYELEARVEALRMQLLPCDLEAWRRRVVELETRFRGIEQQWSGTPSPPVRQGRDASALAKNRWSSDPPRELEVSNTTQQEEQQAAIKIQAIARGRSERKRIGGKVSQHKIGKLEATVSSLQAALGAAEDRFQNEVSKRKHIDEMQYKLQLQLGDNFASFERRLKECEGRLLDEVGLASQATMNAASSASKVQEHVETLAANLSEDAGTVADLAHRLQSCEQQLPDVHSQLRSLTDIMPTKIAELESLKGQVDVLQDKLNSEVQRQVVDLRREPSESNDATGSKLEQLVNSIMTVESRIPTEVDIANEVNTSIEEHNLPTRAELEALQKMMCEWENKIVVEVRLGLESLGSRVQCIEDRHEAAKVAEQEEKAAAKIQARYRGNRDRKHAAENGVETKKEKLPVSKKVKHLEKRLAAWEEQFPAEVEKQAKGCLDEFAKQMPSKVEVQAQSDAARIMVEDLAQRLDSQQERLEELSVDEVKKILEGFVADLYGRLEGHNRDFEEAASARQGLIERIEVLEAQLPNSTVDTVPDDELKAMLARCTGGNETAMLPPGGRAELGHRLREAQHSLVDRLEAIGARLDGMYMQHAEVAASQQALQRLVDSLLQASADPAAPARQPVQQDLVTTGNSDGEPDGQGKQLRKEGDAEAWQNAVRQDLALVQRRISAELRAETQLWLTDQQWAIATLDERLWLTDQRLGRRIDELVLALGRGRQHQQAQVADSAALERLTVGTPEMRSQPLADAPTPETTPPITPPAAHSASTLSAPSPRRQVQFAGTDGVAGARLSAVFADDEAPVPE